MQYYFQLYSARNWPVEEALAIIRDAGYAGVEAFRENVADADRFAAALEATGLTVPSMHVNLQPLRKDFAGSVATLRRFGSTHAVCPFIAPDERPTTLAGWQVLTDELAELGRRMADEGLTFAWHNHDFEFLPLTDGTVPMTVLLEDAPAVHWEIDVAWIVRAKADPSPWIATHRERISAVHVKDIAVAGECTEEDGWADVGHGIMDWPRLLKELFSSPATLYVVEHDNPSDLARFAGRSIATLERQ